MPESLPIELPPLPEPVGWEYSFHNQRHLAVHRVSGIRAVGVFTADQLRAYAEAAVLQERERCAKLVGEVADAWLKNGHIPPPSAAAAAIRGT